MGGVSEDLADCQLAASLSILTSKTVGQESRTIFLISRHCWPFALLRFMQSEDQTFFPFFLRYSGQDKNPNEGLVP